VRANEPGQSIESVRRALAARFKSAQMDCPELDARSLVGAALGLDLTDLIAAAAQPLTRDESARIEGFARRRMAGEPVARILGFKEFWGLPLLLSPATLVPRPDTETVVELALEIWRGDLPPDSQPRIADLGTGSGPAGARLACRVRCLQLRGGVIRHVRSGGVESALYPLGRNRQPQQRGARL